MNDENCHEKDCMGISLSTIMHHNYRSGGIDMKECSAYGQVISPQTATEQPHIYESTT